MTDDNSLPRRLGRFLGRRGNQPESAAAPDSPVDDAERTADVGLIGGRVEQFSPAIVSGWVEVPVGAPSVEISVRVDGRTVAATRAGIASTRRAAAGEVREFRLLLSDLWKFLGPDNQVTVTAANGSVDRQLPIQGHGPALTPASAGNESAAALFSALDAGSLFSRTGRLQQSRRLALPWQKSITDVAESVSELVARHFDYEVFYAYGSMLGAVRENGFLGHDDDLDLGYLSRHRDAAEIGPELRAIALMLIENGWSVEPFGPLLHVYVDDHGRRGRRVDLFPHFFDAEGLLRIPWGMAGSRHLRLDQWDGIVEVPFGDGVAPVPSAAQDVLAQLYGDTWREPQPGFSWQLDRKEKVPAAMMSPTLCDEVYWADFYRRYGFTEPSDFCRTILARVDCPAVVVDLGCGDGRDSHAFATAGRDVTGIDRSRAAISRASETDSLTGPETNLSLHLQDLADQDGLHPLLAPARADGRPVLFYLRFLHALTADDDEALIGSIAAVARPGDMIAAEFRSVADEQLPKAHKSFNRIFRDGEVLTRLLRERHGFTVLSSDHATGRSVYRNEDPDLHRIVARR